MPVFFLKNTAVSIQDLTLYVTYLSSYYVSSDLIWIENYSTYTSICTIVSSASTNVADDPSMRMVESEYSLKLRFKFKETLSAELHTIFVIMSVC